MSLARCDLVSLLFIYLPVAYQHVVEAMFSSHAQHPADADDISMQMCVPVI